MSAAAAPAPPAGIDELRALTRDLLAHDAWPRERLVGHQRERLRATLRHAVAASPYYREVLGPDATAPDVDLASVPILRKETLVERFDDIVTDPRLRLADLEAHLAGPDAEQPYLGAYRAFSTSGTSGLRALVVYDRDDMATGIASSLRAVARQGVGPATRLVAIGSPDPLHLTRQVFAAFRAGRPGVPELTVATPLEEMVQALDAYQPEAIAGYPTVAALLADEQLEGRLHIAPRILAFGSEPTTADILARLDAAWGVRPANVYATTEAPIVAVSSPQDAALDVAEDLLVLEVVDGAGRAVPDGVAGDRILVTSLASRTLPLIRYEIGDVVTTAPGPGPAGRPYRRLASVEGRSSDVLELPGLRGGTVAVHPFRLGRPLAAFPDVRQFQLGRDGAAIVMEVVLRPCAARDVPGRLRTAIVRELEAAGAVAPPVAVEAVAAIARETGPGAKLKLVRAPR
jgi:phenylacetate-coenzyme A ligase PaaK-like adenylate-forming protein